MARLTLSDADKQVRDYFVRTTESLGCKVTVDAMGTFIGTHIFLLTNILSGNIFAVRPGRQGGPATFAGSHLDTQVRVDKATK
jgi:acetylornithine deacetylase/succinyl-diaminopimelate desuccinylase-like protein